MNVLSRYNKTAVNYMMRNLEAPTSVKFKKERLDFENYMKYDMSFEDKRSRTKLLKVIDLVNKDILYTEI